MSNRATQIIAFLAYGLVIYAMAFVWFRESVTGFFLAFLISPVFLGAIAQVIFDLPVKKGYFVIVLGAIGLTTVMFFILLALNVESVICLVIGAPVIVPLEFLGVWLARIYLADRDGGAGPGRMRASLFLIPVLVLPIEDHVPYPQATAIVASEIIVNAPPDAVWGHTVVIPDIQPDERIWTVSHKLLGAPQPVSATIDGDTRQLTWTKGVRFQEIITDRKINERLAWDFHFDDPASLASFDSHVSPNSDMLRVSGGFYHLTALDQGRTLLRLETTYVIRSPFNPYLRFWGSLFLTDFHQSVLAVIKQRAEG